MRRERIERRAVKRPRYLPQILPLDPRDPDVVRAKAIDGRDSTRSDRHRAA